MALLTHRFFRLGAPLAVAGSLILSACASTPTPAPDPEPEIVEETPVVYREFPADSLYELLLAEFAGIREQVEPALEIYTIQAHETRDPGVIARGIHIARFLKRADVILDLAELWVEVEPDNIEVRRLLAFQLASNGRVVEAFPHGEYLLESGDPAYLQSLAAFAVESPVEEKQRLLTLYEELEAEYPDQPGLLLGKAMLLRQLDQLEDSLAATRRLIDIDPDNETGQLLSAQLLHAQGKEKEALRSLKKALRRLPESKRLRLQYARFLSETDLELSRDQIRTLSRLYPEDMDILFSLGLANRELGDLKAAKANFNSLVEHRKRTSDAHFMLARIAEESGTPEDAVYHYRQVKDGQNLLPAAMRTAELYTEHDNLSAAREYLSSLRAIYPALRENLFQMEAELLMKVARLDEARDLLTTAIDENTDSLNLRYARSIVSAEQGDMAAVEEDLRYILDLDGENTTALNALGYTMLNLTDRYSDAKALIEKAHSLEPGNPAILDSLGWAYYRLGNLEQARIYLQQAYDQFPDPEVAAHLGEVLWHLGDVERAKSLWRSALTDNPDDRTLRETLERLQPGLAERLMSDLTADQ